MRKRLIRNASAYSVVSLVEKMAPLLINAYCIRVMSQADFAALALSIFLIPTMRILVEFGQDSLLRVRINSKKTDDHFDISFVLKPWIFGSILVFIVAGSMSYLGLLPFDGGQYFIWLIAAIFMHHCLGFLKGFYISTQNPSAYAQAALVFVIFDLLYFFVLNALDFRVIDCRLASYLGALLTATAISYLSYFKILSSRAKFIFHAKNIVSSDLKYGLFLVIHSFVMAYVFYLDRHILLSQDQSRLVAEITIALTLVAPLLLISDSIGKSYMPWFLQMMSNGKQRSVNKTAVQLSAGLLVVTLFYSIAIVPLGELYAGNEYKTDSFSGLLVTLSFYPLIKFFYQMFARYLLFREMTWVFPVATSLAGLSYLLAISYMSSMMTWILFSSCFLMFYFMQLLMIVIIGRISIKAQEIKA